MRWTDAKPVVTIPSLTNTKSDSSGMPYRDEQSEITAEEAIARLKEGNERFIAGESQFPRIDASHRAEILAMGQRPFATVIACSDSRVPVELVFDQGMGDLFVIRVAGNVCAIDETASAEFSVGYLGTPLLMVLGHHDCGMVGAVLKDADLHGNIPAIVEHVKPAVDRARATGATGEELIDAAVRENVWQSISDLFARSPVIVERVREGKLKVIGAEYNIESGEVHWLGEHPEQMEKCGCL